MKPLSLSQNYINGILTIFGFLVVSFVLTFFFVAEARVDTVAGKLYLPIVMRPAVPDVSDGSTYFISPNGNDNNSGTSPSSPWATFDRALDGSRPDNQLEPGDTLIVMDGTYYQSISPGYGVEGSPGSPITIRAQNDGQAIIDGQGVRTPVYLRDDYFVIEGLVAKNGSRSVWWMAGEHNVLRRVSGYDANTHINNAVFTFNAGAHYNLLEDCVASGAGRKMIVVFQGSNNTIRRCFAEWREWEGQEHCGSHYPWGEALEFYNSSNNLMENSIAYGRTSRAGISIMAQIPGVSNGNKILGSMALLSGMNVDGTPMLWGPDPNNPPLTQVQPLARPEPTDCRTIQQFYRWPELRVGIRVGENGEIRDTLIQDVYVWGSAGPGLAFMEPLNELPFTNNRVNRATVYNNGLDFQFAWLGIGGIGTGAQQEELDLLESVTNSYIENIWTGSGYTTMNGEGARLAHRYVDGVLTDEPLWPWPMEDRIQAELGYSVTEIVNNIVFGGQ